MIAGVEPAWTALALLVAGAALLSRFDGPYNGGADRMSLLALVCLTLAHVLPEPFWREMALGYLAVQLVLSYVLSGFVKIVNPDWRAGVALRDVFLFSTYPVSDHVRRLAKRPKLLFAMSWCVIVFEVAFPIALLTPWMLAIGLSVAIAFHLANAMLFGLNRFCLGVAGRFSVHSMVATSLVRRAGRLNSPRRPGKHLSVH